MKTKHKIPVNSLLAVVFGLGVVLTAPSAVHALGLGLNNATPDQIASLQQSRFQNQANLLGLSVDDIKAGWAEGKSLSQIAKEHGITQDQLKQKIKDAALTALKTRLQALVDKGVITVNQMNQRLQYVQNAKVSGRMGKMGMRHGFGL